MVRTTQYWSHLNLAIIPFMVFEQIIKTQEILTSIAKLLLWLNISGTAVHWFVNGLYFSQENSLVSPLKPPMA